MFYDEVTKHDLKNQDSLFNELQRFRQFHADIVLARQTWWADECTTEADDNYIEAIYKAILKHNPDFEG